VTHTPDRRGFTIVSAQPRREMLQEAQHLRDDALARYTEVDLLVAALREHITDLREERDRLLEENMRLRAQLEVSQASEAAAGARWLSTRSKGLRT
jgi:hypothetical protein